ncbi:MAG: ATP-binding protein [Kofleriaceae bacterium]
MFRHLKFRHRIGMLVALAGAALLAVTAVTMVLGRRSAQELSQSETRYVPLIELDRDLKSTFAQLDRSLEAAASAAEDSELEVADALQRTFVERVRAGREVIVDNGGDPAALERELRTYYTGARELAKAMIAGSPAPAIAGRIEAMQRARGVFTSHLERATAFDRRRLAAAFSTARGSQQAALQIEVAVALGALVLMSLVSWRLTRRTVRSLHAVSVGVEQLARGELGSEIEVASGDEIGDLARQANRTALRLRDYRDRTEALLTETRGQAEQLRTANETVELRNATLQSAQRQLEARAHELERANHELERTSALLHDKVADLENVSNTLSHDLRAPLRSIRAFSQILAESLADKLDEDARSSLDRVLQGGERMGRMLDDLYRLLRLSGAELAAGEVSVEAVLDEVVQDLRADLEQAGASVTHDALPKVRGNPMLVGQILRNLIANAITFRGVAPPVVHVSAIRNATEWELAVRDNGVGVEPEARERVFRLFERLHSTGSGTGIGLTLCRRAAEKLGGRIWISTRGGSGTTFCFTIPHDPASAAPSTAGADALRSRR